MECKRYEPKASISEKFLVQLFSKRCKRKKEKNVLQNVYASDCEEFAYSECVGISDTDVVAPYDG
jgi:hypothetical protein